MGGSLTETHIGVQIRLDRGAFSGRVVDGSAGTLLVAFAAGDAPELRVGANLPSPLVLEGDGVSGFSCGAVVSSRRDTAESRLYGFALDDPGKLSRLLAGEQLPQFDRRTWVRARPPVSNPVPVDVVPTAGHGTGMSLRGRLLDLSGGGLGVTLERDAERFLARSADVVVRLQRPGQERIETFGCRIANRALTEQSEVRYGLEFVHLAGLAPGPNGDYQPAWDCDSCGCTLLLARSHAHCPACGHSRLPAGMRATPSGASGAKNSAPTYFPEWEDLVLDSEHEFSGSDRTCAFCTSTFSEEARFCGACGHPLV